MSRDFGHILINMKKKYTLAIMWLVVIFCLVVSGGLLYLLPHVVTIVWFCLALIMVFPAIGITNDINHQKLIEKNETIKH